MINYVVFLFLVNQIPVIDHLLVRVVYIDYINSVMWKVKSYLERGNVLKLKI